MINIKYVGQIHLAGCSDYGDFLFDSHSKEVWPDVWKFFSFVMRKKSDIPFMIEWDDDIPSYPELEQELVKAKNLWSVAGCHAV